MDVQIGPGRYVVAVSGGVDSMALLDILVKRANSPEPGADGGKEQKDGGHGPRTADYTLIVAHFDHGIREDSAHDRAFVQQAAAKYGLSFVYDEGNLGPDVSEAVARQARYGFLHKVRMAAGADAIITAHHEDDMLETAIINMLRGTGRRGLTSLDDSDEVRRPLLHLSKQQIQEYAKEKGLVWREDSTNQDTKYLRNYVRHKILPRFSAEERRQFLDHIEKLRILNRDIDHALINHLHIHPATDMLDRHWFIMLPHTVARDTLAGWLRLRGAGNDMSKKLLEKLVVAAKTLQPGKQLDVDGRYTLKISKTHLALVARDR